MAKPELGTKRSCQACGQRFYDLNHNPIVCPHCEAVFDPDAGFKPRRRAPAPARAAKPKVVVPEDEEESELAAPTDSAESDDSDSGDSELLDEEETVEDEANEEEESNPLIEDASELEDDDVTSVINQEGEDEDDR